MTWKTALAAFFLIAATLPSASLAAPKDRPGSNRAATCSDKHTTCTDYCVRSKKDLAELNACSRGCDTELLRCERRTRTTSTTNSGTTTAPVTRDPG